MSEVQFTVESLAGSSERRIAVETLIVAGWTGRDPDRMEEHIRELEALGVKRPATVPCFYRVAAARLTTAPRIQVSGGDSSGEAEVLLLNDGGEWWLGLCSDHTDRKVEAYGITVSKQMCDKPCARAIWPFEEVGERWDSLRLTSRIAEGGGQIDYQKGEVAAMLPPQELVRRYEEQHGAFAPGSAMLCGTLPAIGGVRPSSSFQMSLEDPGQGRRIEHTYEIEVLPIVED